jgi:CRP-like cAMP-binding protein
MTDLSKIKDSLLKIHPFTEEQLDQFTGRLIFQKLNKRELLLKPGQISKGITFISTGSLRLYTKIGDNELTLNFFTENTWVADLESLLTQQPSINYIEAFEDTGTATIILKDLHWLMDNYPAFRMLNGLLVNLGVSTTHMASIKTKNPDERYQVLLTTHPDWLNRFPQNQIASYLGMAPETLSRVRARVS